MSWNNVACWGVLTQVVFSPCYSRPIDNAVEVQPDIHLQKEQEAASVVNTATTVAYLRELMVVLVWLVANDWERLLHQHRIRTAYSAECDCF
ncbi:hypothetical protein COO60DRAFT_1547218 [Scenedesmus sp. NREL 46B-D3]|nr:hypothetical protein COO60DRAFT_1547218 [Scenedesmus sp. NREL 46B-D3]